MFLPNVSSKGFIDDDSIKPNIIPIKHTRVVKRVEGIPSSLFEEWEKDMVPLVKCREIFQLDCNSENHIHVELLNPLADFKKISVKFLDCFASPERDIRARVTVLPDRTLRFEGRIKAGTVIHIRYYAEEREGMETERVRMVKTLIPSVHY